MAQAKKGDLVKVHYTGTLDDGSTFDSSEGSEPLQFVIGEGMLIPAFEQAIEGMNPGDTKAIHIGAADAYGNRMDELVFEVEKKHIPQEIQPVEGMQLQVGQEDGSTTPVKVVKVTDDKVFLDANHPLSGCDLNFSLTLVDIVVG